MRNLLFMLIFFHITLNLQLLAQPITQWQKSFGSSYFDEVACIQQTSEGGYILIGSVVSNDGDVSGAHGGVDFWVVKLNDTGLIQWKKAYGGTNNDWPYFIQQTSDGGYIMSGFTESNNGDVSGNHGDKDAWVVKLSSTGAVEWEKCYGGTQWESAHSIQQTTDGGYIFAGIAQSSDGDVSGVHGDLDYWVVKLSESGTIQWQKAFGGSSEDVANSIIQTSDGGYMVAGKTHSNDGDVLDNNGSDDYWLLKLSNNGEVEWNKALGGNSADVAEEVWQTSDGGYVVIGYARFNSSGDITGHHGGILDAWVVKVSADSDIEWQRALGGSGRDWGRSVQQTADGGYIVSASTESEDGDVLGIHGYMDGWLIRLSEMGEILWQKPMGGTSDDAFFSVQQTSDGGYITAGYNWSTDGDASSCNGYNDFWVVKLSPSPTPTSAPSTLPLEIFPNPAQQSISLKNPNLSAESTEYSEKFIVSITDLLGRKLTLQTISTDEQIDISTLPNGMYILSATTPSGKVFSGKFRKLD